VFTGQGISRRCMGLNVEFPAIESIERMAGRAVTAVQPFRELAVMLVSMAVEAHAARYSFIEIGRLVAGETRYGRMLTDQRISGSRMIEPGGQCRLRNIPARRRVTLHATCSECAAVRIPMTSRTIREVQSGVVGNWISAGSNMTLLAGNTGVKTGQRKASPVMVKASHRLPGLLRVA
jgi:hypothetical protein